VPPVRCPRSAVFQALHIQVCSVSWDRPRRPRRHIACGLGLLWYRRGRASFHETARGPHSFGSMLSSRHPRDAAVVIGPAIALSACRWRRRCRAARCTCTAVRLHLDRPLSGVDSRAREGSEGAAVSASPETQVASVAARLVRRRAWADPESHCRSYRFLLSAASAREARCVLAMGVPDTHRDLAEVGWLVGRAPTGRPMGRRAGRKAHGECRVATRRARRCHGAAYCLLER
jgi:hypothetical protein